MVINLIPRNSSSDGTSLVVESDNEDNIWVSIKMDIDLFPSLSEIDLEQPAICVNKKDLLKAIGII